MFGRIAKRSVVIGRNKRHQHPTKTNSTTATMTVASTADAATTIAQSITSQQPDIGGATSRGVPVSFPYSAGADSRTASVAAPVGSTSSGLKVEKKAGVSAVVCVELEAVLSYISVASRLRGFICLQLRRALEALSAEKE